MWWRWWLVSVAGACLSPRDSPAVDCSRRSLQTLTDVSAHTVSLDASYNNISCITSELQHATQLRDLDLSYNPLSGECVSWGGAGRSLSRLSLDGVGAPPDLPLPQLRHLSLRHCRLSALALNLPADTGLRTLLLSHNLLTRIPADVLAPLRQLQTLHLSDNLIAEIDEDDLPPLPALHTLVLKRNRLTSLDGRAFLRAPALRVLRLEENQLLVIPPELHRLQQLEDLCVSYNAISRVDAGVFPAAVVRLDLGHNPLSDLHPLLLYNLTRLTTLVLWWSEVSEVPAVTGAGSLRTVRAAHARLTHVSSSLCKDAPALRTLDVKYNFLKTFPDVSECSQLRVLEVSDNQISVSSGRPLRGARRLHDLVAAHNHISRLPHDFFYDTPLLQTVDLEDNRIEHIDMETFLPLSGLEDLNLGNNRFGRLPTAGLQSLRHVKVHNNPALHHFPPPAALPHVRTLLLSYAYHCCEYMSQADPSDHSDPSDHPDQLTDFVVVPPRPPDPAVWANLTDLWPTYLNLTLSGGAPWAGAGRSPRPQCAPRPGPFLPCADLFEWWSLRCGVWAVFLLALLGNATVVVVLLFSRTRLDVPRFLVANLAAADLLMGLYLGVLAVVDAATLGEFRAHGLDWQMSGGCRLAGFLGVLSSELSVFTLAVITLERNYAITHAMHLNKRLSLRHAGAVMAAGWSFALTAAALPLFGVSDYRKFAVCLPFETSTPASLGYVVALLSVNGLAFLVLLGCYLKMYCAIRGSHAWNSNDSRIAKRMALLVFTDFLCWSPIAFFALTAAFGLRLVSLEEAKVFTVFVLPLNSCCNPFLYAILTKQFKKDCALVCKAIEESRVTRGIGRCRHSSNFSNRQTPANTNSLADRSSRSVHAPSCACRRLLDGEGGAARDTGRLLRWLRLVPADGGGAGATRVGRGSVSSSVEFSSESWRRAPAPRRPATGPSLSSSRDSSSSATTTSTSTWRAPPRRPRLSRQPALDLTAAPALLNPPLPTIPSAAEHD